MGCVTPYIIVPGDWTDDDLNYYADELVAGLVHNAGHNCLKAEIVLTDADWPLRRKFIDAVRYVPSSTREMMLRVLIVCMAFSDGELRM